ncbi:hypothetical protein SteCoe_33106 [Stentor coeruleus]|uniref:B box-type domain-containing protein n=1 Tax=Stentor coeruleus TaxID=5963 RepID=A0A1R2AXL0_9CILI|nr:hypothetical protein SteCoe_33106 [Stentor coeruleus]
MEKCEDCKEEATYICICLENHLCEECLIEHITSDKTLKHRTVSLSHPLLSFLLESGEGIEDQTDELQSSQAQIKALEDFRDKCIELIDSKIQNLQEEIEVLNVPIHKNIQYLPLNSFTPIPRNSNLGLSSYSYRGGDFSARDPKQSKTFQNSESFYFPGSIYRAPIIKTKGIDEFYYKVIVCGGSKTGKSCVIESFRRLHDGDGENSSLVCRGINFDNLKVNMEIFESRDADGCQSALAALVVFDLTRKSTYEEAQVLVEFLENNAHVVGVIILVGTRLDLVVSNHNKRFLSFVSIQNYAISRGVLYEEISAVNGKHVEDIFMRLLRELCKKSNIKNV